MSRPVVILVAAVSLATLGCSKKKSAATSEGSGDGGSGVAAAGGGAVTKSTSTKTGTATAALTPGTGPTFSAIATTSVTVSWEAASDTLVTDPDLEYQLVTAPTTSLLSTLAQAEAVTGADIVLPWTKDALSFAVSGLSQTETVAFAVLVKDQSGNTALYPAQSMTTLEWGAPVTGTAIAVSSVTHTGFHVTWGSATDPNNLTLQYQLVYANATTDIDTVDKANAITGAGATGWVSGTSADLSSLTIATNYAVAVLVRNEADKMALYTPVAQMTLPKRMFVTKGLHTPQFSGTSQVDAICTNDARNPNDGSTYKALISGGANWRIDCVSDYYCASTPALNSDWPLAGNTTYGRPDGTVISTTNAKGLLNFPLKNTFEDYQNNYTDGDYPIIWTGIRVGWITDTAYYCNDWTSSLHTDKGAFIDEAYTNETMDISSLGWPCDQTGALLCVEQ